MKAIFTNFLNCRQYLLEICKVDLFLSKKIGKSKGYTFLNIPRNVYLETAKLNGREFEFKLTSILEEAKSKSKNGT